MDSVCSLNKLSLTVAGKVGEELLHEVAARYVEGMKDMEGRKPGPSSILGEKKRLFFQYYHTHGYRCRDPTHTHLTFLGVSQLKPGEEGGFRVPYNPEGTGCGAAMRSMCIGLR